ncbi:DUF5753 domain-containing protein [Streptomyces albus]|uniref:helix-turn-helix domain-containing protein n=1 Tax=Streptomyces albus TaxID=1888 RepID=UPI0024ACC587|nr:DUF5753 domain-containing protein [Streptomyces albus]MDI6408192.1 DUF5753 domain-containing protein [Streptomyces albus]
MSGVQSGPTTMTELFGNRLRQLRLRRGWSQKELAGKVYVSQARIAQLECACGARPTAELTRTLDTVLGAGGQLVELWPYVYDALPRWSRRFLDRAARATAVREYAAHTVPGLLQTEAYARALLSVGMEHPHLVEERVKLRVGRQARLDGPGAPSLSVVLDQAVLEQSVGGDRVMREQLLSLRRACARHEVRVLPFGVREHAMTGGSFVVLTLPDGNEVAYSEGADHGRLIEDPARVACYARAFDHLYVTSLSAARSARLIERAAARCTTSGWERRAVSRSLLHQNGGGRVSRRRAGA